MFFLLRNRSRAWIRCDSAFERRLVFRISGFLPGGGGQYSASAGRRSTVTSSPANVHDRIAPLAEAGKGHGADLKRVAGSRCQANHGHRAGTGEQSGGLPGTRRASGTDRGIPHLVAPDATDSGSFHHKLGGVAVVHAEDGKFRWRGSAVARREFSEATGDEDLAIAVAVGLNVIPDLLQQTDQDITFVVLRCGCWDSAQRHGG